MSSTSANEAPGADTAPASRRPRSTTRWLLVVGAALFVVVFVIVFAKGNLLWHPARSAELVATYDAYRETGVLLVKQTGTGSWYTNVVGAGPWSSAAWDDDPGAYLLASLLSHVTMSTSPYPGLRVAMAGLAALPMLLLPLTVARVTGRARGGYAMLALPLVMWFTNDGTWLAGTAYGLADMPSPTRVYALYGLAASMAFFSLTVVLALATVRLRLGALVAATVGIGVLAAIGNLLRAQSGLAIALVVGVLWWLNRDGRTRWMQALAGAAAALLIAAAVPAAVMGQVDQSRAEITGQAPADLPDAHTVWFSVYLGLSFPQPVTAQPSAFDVRWSDEWGWQQIRAVDPDVVIGSAEFDAISRDLFTAQVREHPWAAVRTFAAKAAYTVQHFAAMILLAAGGLTVAFRRGARQRRMLGASVAIAAPTILWGLVPAVAVVPLLYYFSELTAGLSLLVAVAVGGLVAFTPAVGVIGRWKRPAGTAPTETGHPTETAQEQPPEPPAAEPEPSQPDPADVGRSGG